MPIEPKESEKKFTTLTDVVKGKIYKPRSLQEKIPLDSKYMMDGQHPYIYSFESREGNIPDLKTGIPTTKYYRCFFSLCSFPKFNDPSFIKNNIVKVTKLIQGHSYTVNTAYLQHFGSTVLELKQNVHRFIHDFFIGKKNPAYKPPEITGYRAFMFLFAVNEPEEKTTVMECEGTLEYKDYVGSEQGLHPLIVKVVGRTWAELAVNVRKTAQYTIDEQCKRILSEKEFEEMIKQYEEYNARFVG